MKLAVLALAAAPLLAACPKPRTSAATQPTPVAFDSAKSDPKALAVVDAGLAAIGGTAPWEAMKELHFGVTYRHDADIVSKHEHWWDRWNGRHYYVETDVSTLGGDPDDVKALQVKQDLFSDRVPWAAYGGSEMPRKDGAENAKRAKAALTTDLYYVAIVHKLKDPGVILTLDNAEVVMPAEVAACKPSCSSVKVTFEAGVGTDTWFVNFNNESKLPEVIEQARGQGRIGFFIDGWLDAGGLKWPGKLQNIGLKSEIIEFDGIKVGEPDDLRYEVVVR
ncbi:MAG: hypothetical protein IPL61_31215 [Myxococcales bacterium]|nr:hypothetical protein [Myxococcales bacterium]